MWVDLDDLHPASVWSSELQLAIEEANAFVFVISPDSVGSSECVNELEHAAVLNKRIIPLSYRRVDVAGLPEALARLQLLPPPQLGCFDDDFERWLQALVSAIDTDLEWVRAHTEWERRALEWQRHDHDRGFLLAGSELEAAEQWRDSGAGKQPLLTEEQTSFIRASREHATRRLRRTRAFVSAALVVAIGLSIAALILRAQAVANQRTAQSRQLAASAEANLGVDPQLSTQLALQALQIKYTTQAETALRDALPNDQLLHTLRHLRQVHHAAFSSDGKLVVTASQDGTARIWNATTGQPTGIVLREPGGAGFESAEFSHDGTLVVTTDDDGTDRVWSVATGQPTGIVLRFAHPGVHNTAVFSPNGRVIVTANDAATDTGAQLWTAATGSLIADVGRAQAPFNDAEFSPNGSEILTAGVDGTAWLWNIHTGRPTGPTFSDVTGFSLDSASFSHDGSLIVTASEDGTAQVWLAGNGALDGPELAGGQLDWAALSPDGKFVVSAGFDGAVRIWKVATGSQVTLLAGHISEVRTAEFSPVSDNVVVSAGIDGTARIWRAQPIEQRLAINDRSGYPLQDAHLSPDGTRILASSSLTSIWNTSNGKLVRYLLEPNGASINSARFDPDGRLIVTASADGTARIWNAASGLPTGTVFTQPGRLPLLDASFSPDGALVVTTSAVGRASVWDVTSGALRATITEPDRAHINAAAFSPSGKLVVTADGDGTARIWDATTGKPTGMAIVNPGRAPLHDAEFSPGGRLLLTAGRDGAARTWDARTGRATGFAVTEPRSVTMNDAEFSPDGSMVLTGADDGTARIWNARSGSPLTVFTANGSLRAHFSTNGHEVVTASTDGTASIWSVALTQPLQLISKIAQARLASKLTPAHGTS